MFIEPRFVLIVVLCCITFAVVPVRFRLQALTAWSLIFYLLYAPRALILVLAAILFTYVLAARRQKWIVIVVIAGLLAYFKRPNGLGALMPSGAGDLQGGGVLVPLGFSYMALELIHYAIESNRGRIRDASFADLAAFALFFPCRVAGPIKRFNDFKSSVARAEHSAVDVYHGCFRILCGLVKKGVFADALARASVVSVTATRGQAWGAMAAYSLSLYLDFSAYSDFAIGVSRLMGIRVPENFNWPYFSSNIQDFWNRWHMSLSFWVRDYVFTNTGRQLFKTRWRARPGAIAAASYVLTFLVVGAWHGLSLHFLVWGLYHGALVTTFHFYKTWLLPIHIATSSVYQSRLTSLAGMLVTFVLVTIGWVFFRLDLPDAARVLRVMLLN